MKRVRESKSPAASRRFQLQVASQESDDYEFPVELLPTIPVASEALDVLAELVVRDVARKREKR